MSDDKNKIPPKRNFFRRYTSYLPWYNDKSDFNTNAKSYYDYLARLNQFLKVLQDFVNRLLNRDLKVKDTSSVKLTKKGNWIDNGECEGEHFDDEIELSADVKISKATESKDYNNIGNEPGQSFTIPNGSKIKSDGVWSPDYTNVLDGIDSKIGDITDTIQNIINGLNNFEDILNNIQTEQTILRNALQKIVDNLYSSGAITSNNINNFNFNNGRNIATGNINLFGGTPDGSSFIRTSSSNKENDITAGY